MIANNLRNTFSSNLAIWFKEQAIISKINEQRDWLQFYADCHKQNYIVQSYIPVVSKYYNNPETKFKIRYFMRLDNAKNFAFLEKIKGQQVDIFDNRAKQFL